MIKRFLYFGAAILLSSILAVAAGEAETESGVVFSHKLHIEDAEMGCLECHAAVAESEAGTDNLFPEKDVCADCHEVEDEEECGVCHTNTDDPMGYPYIEQYSPYFSHVQHGGAESDCATCHAGIANKENVLPYELPAMNGCIDCHDESGASRACEACHTPDYPLLPVSHSRNFLHTHADMAQSGIESLNGNMSCSHCHSENYCQDCHQGNNLDRRTHPLNYAFMHSLEAQGKEKECASCHYDRQFCNECHRNFQILPHNHVGGWVNAIPGDGGRHSFEAQNDIENCRSCHEANAAMLCGTAGCHPAN
jgi:hypothetical protein